MTTSDLTWSKAKDSIVVGIGALIVMALGFLLSGQAESNKALGQVQKDIAVLTSETRRDREDVSDLKGRVRDLETSVKKGRP